MKHVSTAMLISIGLLALGTLVARFEAADAQASATTSGTGSMISFEDAAATQAHARCRGTPDTGSAMMCLSRSAQRVAGGDTFTVEVVVNHASDLAAFEFKLAYDDTLLTAVSAAPTGYLGGTGRAVSCPVPILILGSIDFGCASAGAAPPGPTGSGVVATVTFRAATVKGASALHFAKALLGDPLADPITVTATDGRVLIRGK